jgi:hypothetical protein
VPADGIGFTTRARYPQNDFLQKCFLPFRIFKDEQIPFTVTEETTA